MIAGIPGALYLFVLEILICNNNNNNAKLKRLEPFWAIPSPLNFLGNS
jgi:hypothetical protein